jgi:hypothetical protein
MNRRSFFRRLAAVAALPFVRWRKPKPVGFTVAQVQEMYATLKDHEQIERCRAEFMARYQGPQSDVMTINEYRKLQGRKPA